MSLFEQRERAAESAFAHEEESRFVARRRAVQALSDWAARCMGLDAEGTEAYKTKLVDLFAANTLDDRLIARVQTDLERAGKPTMTTQVGTVFSWAWRAIAEATDALKGRIANGEQPATDALDSWDRRHRTDTAWGSLRF